MQLDIKGVSFRAFQDADLTFLQSVYRSSREHELSLVPWTEQEKTRFIEQQFGAQHAYYQEHFKDASFDLVIIHGKQAGRLYLDERNDEFRILDIALLPGFRGQGWGSKILAEIQRLAKIKGKRVGIHVEKNNPAMTLYLRMGFENREDKGVYQFMVWEPVTIKESKKR